MNRKYRFMIAVLLTILVILTATSVWAAPKFHGTVPPVPTKPAGHCLKTVNMGTAIFTVHTPDCMKVVEWVKNPAKKYVHAPKGMTFVGGTFMVVSRPKDAIVQVCYAYPPKFADKNANIYRLNKDAKPNVWVEIPGATISKGTICVNSAAGIFSLIGKR